MKCARLDVRCNAPQGLFLAGCRSSLRSTELRKVADGHTADTAFVYLADADADGMLSAAEFAAIGGDPALFAHLDTDGSGRVSLADSSLATELAAAAAARDAGANVPSLATAAVAHSTEPAVATTTTAPPMPLALNRQGQLVMPPAAPQDAAAAPAAEVPASERLVQGAWEEEFDVEGNRWRGHRAIPSEEPWNNPTATTAAESYVFLCF